MKQAGTSGTWRAIVAVILVAAGLTAADRALARIEAAETERAAERAYRKGLELRDAHRPADALDLLRQAHATERENPAYALALIEALTDLGKIEEANRLADEVLATRPNDGQANLVAARLMVKEGKPQEADAYYHRAIYGSWSSAAADHERAARLELVTMLVGQKEHPRLLGELIALAGESDDDIALKQQIAHLFLAAGSPSRAAALYREIIAHEPHDAKAFAALGEAELEDGQYRAARMAFQQASFFDPSMTLQPRLQLLTEVTALDPTPRRLTSLEKYQRSMKILALAKNDLERWLNRHGRAVPESAASLLREADAELARKAPSHVNNEMAEHELDLAEQIWRARSGLAGERMLPEEEALRLIMERLSS